MNFFPPATGGRKKIHFGEGKWLKSFFFGCCLRVSAANMIFLKIGLAADPGGLMQTGQTKKFFYAKHTQFQ
jgi:hypothetical protein